MCRNIRTLYNFDPPASEEEIRAAALQYVRKVSGYNKPSQANTAAFQTAVDSIAGATRTLLNSLQTGAAARDRAEETVKAKARSQKRFGDRT